VIRAGAFAATGATVLVLATGSFAQPQNSGPAPDAAKVALGRQLYVEGCSSCHGMDARGVDSQGPSLIGVGAAAADFYLRTGRMPLAQPGHEPQRTQAAYSDGRIEAIDAYIASLGGPAIPVVHPELGSISRGAELFGSSCAGCHSITGEGGVVVGGFAPELHKASPTEVAEAVRVGPYLMPSFDRNQVSDADLNSIARYVDQAIQQPDDRGGWGIGHLGPVPEGLIAWVIAAAALLLIARMIGERSSGDPPEEDS
jgi:ubiquinol-cytochrome c reductase cytochrome c subunit